MAQQQGALDAMVASPLQAIQRRMDAAIAAGVDVKTSDCADYGLKEELRAILLLDSAAAAAAIPLLTTEAFQRGAVKNHTLVRYRGMIQDMFEPEFFSGAQVVAQPQPDGTRRYLNSSFADLFEHPGVSEEALDEDMSQDYTRERVPLFCVPTPGNSSASTAAGAIGSGSAAL